MMDENPTDQLIYKVVSRDQWAIAETKGVFTGAEIDLADGYIHFSTNSQVAETLAKHFAGRTDLLLVAFEPSEFGDQLKWEPSRGGDLFPHLYQPLDIKLARSVHELSIDANGDHQLPDPLD